MLLEDYFEFIDPNEIKIKGHRIWLEDILHEYLYRERTAEQIARRFPTLTLEQVYAALLYYLHNQESMNKYMADSLEHERLCQEEQQRKHPEFEVKVRRLLGEKESRKKIMK